MYVEITVLSGECIKWWTVVLILWQYLSSDSQLFVIFTIIQVCDLLFVCTVYCLIRMYHITPSLFVSGCNALGIGLFWYLYYLFPLSIWTYHPPHVIIQTNLRGNLPLIEVLFMPNHEGINVNQIGGGKGKVHHWYTQLSFCCPLSQARWGRGKLEYP